MDVFSLYKYFFITRKIILSISYLLFCPSKYAPIATVTNAISELSPVLNQVCSSKSSPEIRKNTEMIISIIPYCMSLLAIVIFRKNHYLNLSFTGKSYF